MPNLPTRTCRFCTRMATMPHGRRECAICAGFDSTRPDDSVIFATGWQAGRLGDPIRTPRWVATFAPTWTADQVDVYLNGMDDGRANDTHRLLFHRQAA